MLRDREETPWKKCWIWSTSRATPSAGLCRAARRTAFRLRHRTSHVWLVRRKNGVLEVLLQKRSDEKDSFPGCYDISSAGHIPAGQGFVDSALRELKEELGVTAQPQDLFLCGQRSFQFSAVFHGKPFKDNQVSNVYLLWLRP